MRDFECLRQTGSKNAYAFGASMVFASARDYQAYNEHPDHVRFVQTRWLPEVVEFIELGYEPLARL